MDNYVKSCQKWRELLKKIFGTVNITWRLDPANGQIFFSTNGIEQIKATVVLLGMTKATQNGTQWVWAWAKNNRMFKLLPSDNRITPVDISDYLADGGSFEEDAVFKSESVVLNNTQKGKYLLQYMRAKMLEILEGQFIYEADTNGSNAIFVILKAKKIKQTNPDLSQEPPESGESQPQEQRESPETQESRESEQSDEESKLQKSRESQKPQKSRNSTETSGSKSKKIQDDES